MDRNELGFRLAAYHSSAPVTSVVAVLGNGSLQLEAGEYSTSGEQASEATWVSTLFSVKGSLEWPQALGWLQDHLAAIDALVESGWTVEAEIRIVAREPIARVTLPLPFVEWLTKVHVPIQIIVSPRPILLNELGDE